MNSKNNKIKLGKIRIPLPKQKEMVIKDKTKYTRKEKHKTEKIEFLK